MAAIILFDKGDRRPPGRAAKLYGADVVEVWSFPIERA